MIKGCDVSSVQGKNWSPPAGFDFVYVKATEGTSYVNPYHDEQADRSRQKGLVVGHYCVVREGHSAASLADYFQTHAKAQPGDFYICDWEKWKVGSKEIIVPCSTKDAFIKNLQKNSPFKSGLYCNVDAWLHEDTTSFVGDVFAIAYYSSQQPPIQHPWQIWQYSSAGGLDKNRGIWRSRAEMRAWALGTVPLIRWAPVYGDAAIKAAKAWIGKPYGIGWCEKFTNELFQTGPVGDFDHDNDADAVDAWEAAVQNGKVVRASQIAHMNDVPGGVQAFWSGGSHGYGHAAPTIGGGDIVSTDLTGNSYTPGTVGRAPLTAPHDVWGLKFEGYALVEGNGYTLYQPAAPIPVKPPPPEEEPVLEEQKPSRRSLPVTVKPSKAGDHDVLPKDDLGNVTIAFGAGEYEVHVFIRVDGEPGDELQLAGLVANTVSGSGDWVSNDFSDNVPIPVTTGHGYRQFVWKESVSPAPKGQTRRIRLAAQNFTDHDLTVTDMKVKVWKGPYQS